MGDGRTVQNPRLIPGEWFVPSPSPPPIPLEFHSESGPGICAPYLFNLGWLDMANVKP